MQILTINIKDSKVLKLIHDLEDLDLIQIVDITEMKPQTNLSELLRGSISIEDADIMQKELNQMRKEWRCIWI